MRIPKASAQQSSENLGVENDAPASQPHSGLSLANQTTLLAYLLTRAEVAKVIGVCCHSVARYTRRGLLPAVVINRRLIRYRREDVEKFIANSFTGKEAAQ